jgi:hypothetical protein
MVSMSFVGLTFPESKLLFERIEDLAERVLQVDAAHEKLMNEVG